MTTKDFDKLNLELFGLDKPKAERFSAEDYREALKNTIEETNSILKEINNTKFSEVSRISSMIADLSERLSATYNHYV